MIANLMLAAVIFTETPQGRTVTEVPDAALHTTCVRVNDVHFDVVGPIHFATDGRVLWTNEQLGKMAEVLTPDEMRGVLMLKRFIPREEGFGDGPTPIPEDQARPTPVTPACGECKAGHLCNAGNPPKPDCCSNTSGTSCLKCRTCPRAIAVEP